VAPPLRARRDPHAARLRNDIMHKDRIAGAAKQAKGVVRKAAGK
jgi:hypothetical protein